tara:strand:+ start:126 stop:500 length:375 start_codon:yes stop_codon:yes gene_type:complete
MSNCPFCNIDDKRIISNYDDYYVIRDLFPVTELHTLIIPKRCVASYFDLNDRELYNLQQIIKKEKEELINIDKTISGFNLGVNDGLDAGQTIFHCHVHLIPRRKNDVDDPRGGVRGVIPLKQKY